MNNMIVSQHNGRNRQIDVMLYIGILSIVFGHIDRTVPLFYFMFFPPYTFHVPLFFFISGYLFKPQSTLCGKYKLIFKKIRTQLIPYYLFAFIFAIITVLLKKININLGGDFSLKTILTDGFFQNNTYALFGASWFLFALFFVNVIAAVLYPGKVGIDTVICILSVPVMIYFLRYFHLPMDIEVEKYGFFLKKLSICFVFYSLGHVFKLFEGKIRKYLITPMSFSIILITVILIFQFSGSGMYDVAGANFGQDNGQELFNLVSTVGIILLLYIIGYYVSSILSEKSLVWIIAENTFAIMVWHFTFFLIANCIFVWLGLAEYSNLSDKTFRYWPEKFWLVYQFIGVFGPVLLAICYKKLKSVLIDK